MGPVSASVGAEEEHTDAEYVRKKKGRDDGAAQGGKRTQGMKGTLMKEAIMINSRAEKRSARETDSGKKKKTKRHREYMTYI